MGCGLVEAYSLLEERLCLQTRLNKVSFPTLDLFLRGLWSTDQHCLLPVVPDHAQPRLVLAPALLVSAEMLLAWLGQREAVCEGDPASCCFVGGARCF